MQTSRRSFIRTTTLSGVGLSLFSTAVFGNTSPQAVRLAYLTDSCVSLANSEGGSFAATLHLDSLNDAAFRHLLQRDDIDALVVDVAPARRVSIAVAAMKAGRITAFTGPVGQTTGQLQLLAQTFERTQTPCLLLDEDQINAKVQAISELVEGGKFGEITSVQCGTESPTNGLGPTLGWLGINQTNRFTSLNASVSQSWGLHEASSVETGRQNGVIEKHYELGEVLTINLQCSSGQAVTVYKDLKGNRPYNRGYHVQGTRGLWVEDNELLTLDNKSVALPTPEVGQDALSALKRALSNKTITPTDTRHALAISLVYAVAKASLGAWGEEVEMPNWFV